MLSRRDLLKLGSAAALSLALPGIGRGLRAHEPTASDDLDWDRILVLVELKGGNDGLNTVIPYADPLYPQLRTRIAIGRDQVLRLSPQLGLNPRLHALMAAWEAKDMAIVLGCGYPQPNRSHFRGIDIWNTGSSSEEMLREGWLARLLDGAQAHNPDNLLAHAVLWDKSDSVGHAGLGPLHGRDLQTLIMESPGEFMKRTRYVEAIPGEGRNPAHAHILNGLRSVVNSRNQIAAVMAQGETTGDGFPNGRFGDQLRNTTTFITAGARVPVYKLTLNGFDTHSGQRWHHERLLEQLGNGLAEFRKRCIAADVWDRVLVMTYSEFGRRAHDNASGGTDHGTAAPHFLLGGKVKGGTLYGDQPALDDLAYGDLKYTTDYRQMYQTVAREWWRFGDKVLTTDSVKPLGAIRS